MFSRGSLIHAIAGMVGGVVSMQLLYPLDQVRHAQQTGAVSQKGIFGAICEMIHRDGFASLYDGIFATQVALAFSNFIFFFSAQSLKDLFKRMPALKGGPKELLVNMIAGVVNVLICNPLWVIASAIKANRSRRDANQAMTLRPHTKTPISSSKPSLQSDADDVDDSIADTAAQLFRKGGIAGFWNGTSTSLILVSNPIIHYLIYQSTKQTMLNAKRKLRNKRNMQLSAVQYFALAAFAKTIATFFTYPLQLAQANMRTFRNGLCSTPRVGPTAELTSKQHHSSNRNSSNSSSNNGSSSSSNSSSSSSSSGSSSSSSSSNDLPLMSSPLAAAAADSDSGVDSGEDDWISKMQPMMLATVGYGDETPSAISSVTSSACKAEAFGGDDAGSNFQRQISFADFLSHRLRERGWTSLFEGLDAKLLQTVLTAAFHLVAYEKIVGAVYVLLYRPRTINDSGHHF